jgi:AAA15 family ATPase/GTPase
MLIRYNIKNFRSFKNLTSLSLKANRQTTLNANLIRNYNERILPSAVIYGANASGKTNIILSFEILKTIVIKGSISHNISSLWNLELYPFTHSDEKDPIFFEIDFTSSDYRFVYSLAISVGKLKKEDREIVHEKLSIVENKNKLVCLFSRDTNHVVFPSEAEGYFDSISNIHELEKRLNDNLDATELFLARGFKNTISNRIAESVIEFFTDKLFVTCNFPVKRTKITSSIDDSDSKSIALWNNALDAFVKGADFGPQELRYEKKDGDEKSSSEYELVAIYGKNKNRIRIPAELMESRGTIKLIDFAVEFIDLFETGGTLIIDEFDSSLHPELVKGIISLFNNQKTNTKGAQLIFTTHNPIYLNNKIFRRDQIIFVEKDKSTYQSDIHTLADFGSVEVRNDENYLINYFKGKYATLPFIDFSELLQQVEEKL